MKKNFLSFTPFSTILVFIAVLFAVSCEKITKEQVVHRRVPFYNEVSTVRIENYVNRMFIDLVGREPLDSEMVVYVNRLRADSLKAETRNELIYALQFDTTFREGENSYHEAYYHWFYENAKGRFYREFSGDESFHQDIGLLKNAIHRDSLNGDSAAMEEHQEELEKLQNVLNSKDMYRNKEIGFKQMMGFMVNNSIYDKVNMNTFNFINATFDNLFYRFPTDAEFYNAFDIIEYNESSLLWGQPAQTKDEYINIILNSREFYNGMIVWAYRSLLARDPSTIEMSISMKTLYIDNDFQYIQRQIMITDEYAQIEPDKTTAS